MHRVGIIGLGNLGRSLASLMESNHTVIGSTRHGNLSNQQVVEQSDVIILAVKPTQIRGVCEEIQADLSESVPVISTAAAVPLNTLYRWLPQTERIIRCMPNLPCQDGRGIVPTYDPHNSDLDLINELFSPNRIMPVVCDAHIDIATIISGCGPALFSWFGEQLHQYGIQSMSSPQIRELISNTMIGTGELMKDISPDQIIKRVSSPQGATEAALQELNRDTDLQKAIHSAYLRLQDLKDELDR